MIEAQRHNPGWDVLSLVLHGALLAALVFLTPVRELVIPKPKEGPPPAEKLTPDQLEKLDESLAEARSRELQRDIVTLQTVLNDMDVVRDRLREDFDEVVEDLAAEAKDELRKSVAEAREIQREVLAKQDNAAKTTDRIIEAEKGDLSQTAQKAAQTADDFKWKDMIDVATSQANAQNALDRVATAADFSGYEKVAEAARELREKQIEAARLQSDEGKRILEPIPRIAAFAEAVRNEEDAAKKAAEERKAEASERDNQAKENEKKNAAAARRDEAEKRQKEAEARRNQTEEARRTAERERDQFENQRRDAENRQHEAENNSRNAENEERARTEDEKRGERERNEAQSRADKAERERNEAHGRFDQAERERNEAQNRANQADQERNQAQERANQAERERNDAQNRANQAERERNDAQNRAGQAEKERNDAQNRANQAERERNDAQNRANQAERERNDAQNRVNQAEKERNDAQNRVNQAEQERNDAQNRANQSEGEEKKRAENDVRSAQDRKSKAENETRSAQERKEKAENDVRSAQERKAQAENEARSAQERKAQAENEKRAAEERKTQAENEKRAAEERKGQAENEARAAQDRKNKAENEVRAAQDRKSKADNETHAAQDRKDRAEREERGARERKERAERERAEAEQRKNRAAEERARAAERKNAEKAAAAAETEKRKTAENERNAAQERERNARQAREAAERDMNKARQERERAENERRASENRAAEAERRAQSRASLAQEQEKRAADERKKQEEARAFARSVDTAAQRAAQERARAAQQAVLDAMDKLDQAIESDVPVVKSHSPSEETPGGELARRNAANLSLSDAYELARDLEEAVTDSYREVMAAGTAIDKHLSLEEAERLTDVAKPVRPDFDAALLDGRARTAEALAAQKEARYHAARETEDMVSASMAMMNEAFALAGFGKNEFRDGDRRSAQGLAWLRPGDLAPPGGEAREHQGHGNGRVERFHALSGLSAQLESAAAEDRGMRAKDLTELTKMGGRAHSGDRPGENDFKRVAGKSPNPEKEGAGRGAPTLRGGDWRTGPGTGDDLLPGNVLGVSENADGRPGSWMYLESWWVIGPFPNPDRVNITRRFPPESVIDLDASYAGEGGLVKWRFVQARSPFSKDAKHVRAEVRPRDSREYAIWYGWTQIVVDQDCDVWLAAGSDDRSDVWLNGMKVWASGNNLKVWDIAEGFRKVHLHAGANSILVRLENGHGPTGFSVCISPHDPPPAL